MCRPLLAIAATLCLGAATPTLVSAQTVLHLHKETAPSGWYLLRTGGPDATAFAIVSPDYKNTNATLTPVANFSAESTITGRLPANSVVSISLWMKKSSTYSTVYPSFFLRVANGPTICPWTNGATALTTTLTLYTISCTTQTDVTALSPLYLAVGRYFSVLPGSHSLTVELDVEGTLNGNYDSTLTLPPFQQGATLTGINPTSGIAGDSVTVSGAGFGAQQGASGITFNGLAANVVTWSDSSVGVTIPSGAKSGDVLAWVGSTPSNALAFSVFSPPTITALSPSGGPIGQSFSITGTNFGATQGTGTATLNGSALSITSWADTSITAAIPVGATSGPVVVTTHSQPSNSLTFMISPPGGPTSTYHLHKEASTTSGLFQLQSNGPDGASLAVQTIDLKNLGAGYIAVVKELDTQAGVPNLSGSITGGSAVSFTLWMKKTADFGVVMPMVRTRLNNASGASLCDATGASALTTTLVAYTLSCTTTSNLTINNSDRLYVWVGVWLTTVAGNHSVKGELDVEGALNGNYDSRLTVPGIVASPTLTTLSVPAGAIGQAITLSGTNFGAIQDFSKVTFGGVVAPVSTWNDTSITVAVPAGATTGPVVVTRLQSSNALSFTVLGAITGTARTSSGAAIQSASVQASQAGQVLGSATSNSSGTFLIGSLQPGTYDATATVAGLDSQSRVVAVSSGAQTNVDFTLRASGVTYSYDSLNRLTSVTDGQGASAAYVYDAVGNLLAIERNSAGGVTLLSLSPVAGVPGAVVTIAGTGFGSQVSQNSVQFNGVAASVLASTPTQLTVVVPTGATTGPIAVSTPNGSATSSAAFTVDASAGPPMITSFSPVSGFAGIAVTINGTFDNAANLLKLNQSLLQVMSHTSNAIGTVVPLGVGSGRFTVTTPTGSATSAGDFFVFPPPEVNLTIEFMGRTSIGQPATVVLPHGSSAGTYGLLLFDATAGQRVSVKATNVVGGSFCLPNIVWAYTTLYGPDNVGGPGPYCNFNAPYTLPLTGTYAVSVLGADSSTITVYEVHDKAAPIAINQSFITTQTIDTPGQVLSWPFNGVAGQPISVWLSPAESSGYVCYPSVATITNPAGVQIASFNPCAYLNSATYYTLQSSGLFTLSLSMTYGDSGGIAPYARVTSP